MTESERIRKILGVSRAEFSRRYNIPVRTLENWDAGIQNPPAYVLELLERVVTEDKNMKYILILSVKGEEEVIDIGDLGSMTKKEQSLRRECRKKDADGAEMDCYIISEVDYNKSVEAQQRWEELTEEDKADIIEVDGRKYVRKIYENNHK